MKQATLTDEKLYTLQMVSCDYYMHETNPANGLVADKTQKGSPASIAAVGLALSAYPGVVEHGGISRVEAAQRVLTPLRYFWKSPQGPEPDATGYKGFYYHFLDMQTGRRAWRCELSTLDTALLLAGILTVGVYFDQDTEEEQEIRTLAEALYRRVDWRWALSEKGTVRHGWRPESGFIPYRYEGYDEALILYILGLGSPTYPLPEESYGAWASTYEWKKVYGHEFLYSGPLFTHQLSHIWIDFLGIQDAYMRAKGIDYFENSRRATYIQREYTKRNPLEFEGYSEWCWGITASDGPGWTVKCIKGVERRFFDYVARGAPFGPDDGTLAPWATVASLPFAPEIVRPTIQHYDDINLGMTDPYGFKATFNPTFPSEAGNAHGYWVSPWHFGLDQGPIVLMIENYRTELLWRLMRRCPYIVTGLHRAGFINGWL